ncbi:MAG: GNAT family N-acetyltransferase [Burkholderiaceae bacterium]
MQTRERIRVGDLAPPQFEAARRFLCAQGWGHRVGDAAAFAALLRASQCCAVAIDGQGEVIGFARAITDGLSNGYLSMVAVSPAHRRQGLGRALVEHIIGASPASVSWMLRAGRDGAAEFFAALGFRASSAAMERRRSR